ncbi:TrmH family RNA methyltransferase [Canibacter oris]|uniref:TrmH family RNA methyltransferase n=1 Tax=Canibacter oris TaxID=1365628 RepID=A0A840DKH6_9MICO|nr:RNA methyltransferase [Canibacter oris]MBB4071958.1 TrmH family RNA methyltransferase [Canibacter oris]MBB4072215.1 TrmH family RNA methyltransferase [Canibacter oris]
MIENPGAGQIKKAAQLLRKKDRLAAGRFLVEGPHAILEALTSGARIHVIYATVVGRSNHFDVERAADSAGVRIEMVTPQVLAKLSDTVTPQGLIAVVDRPAHAPLTELARSSRLLAILHDVRDPGNAGTVLRAADAAGADAVIFTGDSVDPWHPKVVRATTGSLFHLPVLVEKQLDAVLEVLHAADVTSIAADLRGAEVHPGDALLRQPVAWVFGNEARGLTAADSALCTVARKLPIYGAAESLNLATAAAVSLYTTAFAQRG